MKVITNELTFAIIVSDGGWRTDLTTRYCEYYSYCINDQSSFASNIIICDGVDDALSKCKTKYLLIQSGGHITFQPSFFQKIDNALSENKDLFIGSILLADDYIQLETTCLVFNMDIWKELKKPAYNKIIRNGPDIKVSISSSDKFRPYEIETTEGERVFVTSECGFAGANIAISQLDTYGKCRSLSSILTNDDYFLLDISSALSEIHSETTFEKIYLNSYRNNVRGFDSDDTSYIQDGVIDFIAAPARGLKALTIAEHFRCSKLLVFDNSKYGIELQKRIFGITEPSTYGEVVDQFLKDYPNAKIIDNWKDDKFCLIKPLPKEVEIIYSVVDLFSFQVEDFIKQLDHTKTLLIDFSDIYITPHNYYRRPMYQVQGLFAEVYSLLKSRASATYILGFAPGFQKMDSIEINTATVQFDMDPTFDPFKKENDEDELPEFTSPIFTPSTKKKDIKEDVWKPPVVKEDKKESGPLSPIDIAIDIGYKKITHLDAINIVASGKILLVKDEIFDDFNAVFEYTVDVTSGVWSFKVGIPNSDKRIEFSNGLSLDGFKKHLMNDVKINPLTTSRYFLNT